MRYTSQSDAHVMRRLAQDPYARVKRHLNLGSLTQVGAGAKAGVSAGSTSIALGTGIASAVGAGAAAGSVVPIVGTAIGVLVALAVSGVFSHKVDPEVGNFNNAIALANAQGPQAVLNIQDKYLVLAGLFDLQPSQIKGNIPIYKKFGRMGEQAFVRAMCAQIQNAANSGVINDNDTITSVYSKVVLPWINSFGYGAMSDTNGQMITNIIIGLIGEYVTGQYLQRWFAVGGDMPFGNMPAFYLPTAAQPTAPSPTASPTPSPVAKPVSAAAPVTTLTELQSYQSGHFPNVGDMINYASNGQAFLALPGPMQYVGQDVHTGAWLVKVQGQVYELQGSTLNPYADPNAAPVPQTTPVPGVSANYVSQQTAPAQPAVAVTDDSGNSVPAQYIPAPASTSAGGTYTPLPVTVYGGGGSGAPLQATAQVSASGFNMEEIGIGAAVLIGLVLLMSNRGHSR